MLVADDDDDFRAVVAEHLRREGYVVTEARNGTELLRSVVAGMRNPDSYPLPDLIVTDLQMPGLSGAEVAIRLRRAGCTIPIVVMTAFASDQDRSRLWDCGAAAVLDKPFDMSDLRTAVWHALHSSGAHPRTVASRSGDAA
jgi:CheY-like chemotaxis protein